MRSYSELIKLPTFEERFEYLRLDGEVGKDTFGFDRYINQSFYRCGEWKNVRDQVIIRDQGCDLGIPDRQLFDHIIIHHMNPVTREDLINKRDALMDPEYLICVSNATHNAIHYGDEKQLVPTHLVERRPNDTCPWK